MTIYTVLGEAVEFNETNLFCPNCGQQTVFVDSGEGDFYEGRDYWCSSCSSLFTMPTLNSNSVMYRKEAQAK